MLARYHVRSNGVKAKSRESGAPGDPHCRPMDKHPRVCNSNDVSSNLSAHRLLKKAQMQGGP